jgi:hypothetical protein
MTGQAAYTDEINGFSLNPPAGTERMRETNSRRLVAWVKRDDKSQAILWTLEVLKIRSEPSSQPFTARANGIAEQMRKDRFLTEAPIVGSTAGKPSADFRGEWKGALPLWRRQTWVQTGANEYLVLDIFGPIDLKDEIDRTLTLADSSLSLFDPRSSQAERRANLQRGQILLEALKIDTLRKLVATKPYFYSLSLDNKTIGVLRVAESIADRSSATGLLVVRSGVIRMPGSARRLSREELFATADRSVESWKRLYIEGEGQTASPLLLEAVKQEDMIVVTSSDTRQPTLQKKIPQALLGSYLPQAFDLVLPRLLDRKTPQAYSFAMYSVSANDFDLRTIKVIGPANMQSGGESIPVVHLSDQAAADAAPANIWVDAKGNTVQARSSEGLLLQQITATEAGGLFAADMAELDQLEKAK